MLAMVFKSAVFAVLLPLCMSLSIREIIEQRQELSTLAQYMRGSTFMNELGASGRSKYTFFAPHNDAFDRIPAELNQRYGNSPSSTIRDEFDGIMKYHTMLHFDGSGAVYSNMIGQGGSRYPTMALGNPNMYLSQLKQNYYMNGARMTEPDIAASNGIVHIIDHFHSDIGRNMNLYEFLSNNAQSTQTQNGRESTRKFLSLLTLYETMQKATGNYDNNMIRNMNHLKEMTLFVPTDDAINRISAQHLGLLQGNSEQLAQVMHSHLILGSVQHSNYMAQSLGQPIDAMYGKIIPRQFGNNMYVSNNCVQGRLYTPNITLSNGVVHMVDSVLGFMYNDAHQQLEGDDTLNRFYGHVQSGNSELENMLRIQPGITGDIPISQQVTVFAPINSAFSDIDLTQDSENLNNVLRMHMMTGRLPLEDMLDGMERETNNPGTMARFYRDQENQDVYVEANHVRARIVSGNICVRNGIIHKIDRVIGYTDRTIMDVIESDPQLTSLYRTVTNAGLTTFLSDPYRKITLFAPMDEGFEQMRQGIQGSRLLDSQNSGNLRNVLNRHMLQYELYTDELTDQSRSLQTMFDKININRRAPKDYYLGYGSQKVDLVKYDIRCSNGVIHYTRAVMYSEGNPNANEWVGAASATYVSAVLLITAQLALLLW